MIIKVRSSNCRWRFRIYRNCWMFISKIMDNRFAYNYQIWIILDKRYLKYSLFARRMRKNACRNWRSRPPIPSFIWRTGTATLQAPDRLLLTKLSTNHQIITAVMCLQISHHVVKIVPVLSSVLMEIRGDRQLWRTPTAGLRTTRYSTWFLKWKKNPGEFWGR